MWVEDTPSWYKETKEIVEMDIEDRGLVAEISYINDGQKLLDKLQLEQAGFKLYDIFFIDYSLSSGVVGSSIIRELRRIKIDSDILFYSSDYEQEIRKEVIDDLNSFEGVYIANRTNFREKSLFLIEKNARKLLSLSNIRGLLTDQTSENDYTIISYLYNKFDKLTPDQREELSAAALAYLHVKQHEYETKSKKEIERIEKSGIQNINSFLGLPSYVVPIELKYMMFKMITEFIGEEAFEDHPIEDYLGKIIKLRNTIAHKKLDVCRMQNHILYYDNIRQFCNRQCPAECPDRCEEQTNNFKISVDNWKETRRRVIEFGRCFDAILNGINKEVFGDMMAEAAPTRED
jgi:hypothetical protein